MRGESYKMLQEELSPIIIPEDYKYIAAFPTMKCNLSCGFCLNAFSDNFRRSAFNEISSEKWIKALNRFEIKRDIPITLGGGEPFVYSGNIIKIINGLKPGLKIDLLTNLRWGEKGIKMFIDHVDPKRLNRGAPYPNIRVSYHPGQNFMNPDAMIADAIKMKDAGFSIGIYSVLYPSPEQSAAIVQMQAKCANAGILYRVKEFTGMYQGQLYGDYNKFPESTIHSFPDMDGGIPHLPDRDGRPSKPQESIPEHTLNTKTCECKPSDFIIGPNGDVYRCHRDLYAGELAIGSILDPNFKTQDRFLPCSLYGLCHPCDVKVKTDSGQHVGHTSVEIVNVRENTEKRVVRGEELLVAVGNKLPEITHQITNSNPIKLKIITHK